MSSEQLEKIKKKEFGDGYCGLEESGVLVTEQVVSLSLSTLSDIIYHIPCPGVHKAYDYSDPFGVLIWHNTKIVFEKKMDERQQKAPNFKNEEDFYMFYMFMFGILRLRTFNYDLGFMDIFLLLHRCLSEIS